MRLARALEDKKKDVRLLDKMLHEGKLTQQEYKEYFDQLSDDTSNATTTDEVEKQRQNS